MHIGFYKIKAIKFGGVEERDKLNSKNLGDQNSGIQEKGATKTNLG